MVQREGSRTGFAVVLVASVLALHNGCQSGSGGGAGGAGGSPQSGAGGALDGSGGAALSGAGGGSGGAAGTAAGAGGSGGMSAGAGGGAGAAGSPTGAGGSAPGAGGDRDDGGAATDADAAMPAPDAADDRPTCATTLSGTVRDPAGKLPIHGALVYVPTTTVAPITSGVSCDHCGAAPSGTPVTSARSDTQGHFKLDDVPPGSDVPLVIQVGKWRRQVTIPSVTACQDNATDADLTRLPRTQSEGHIPKIAVVTGKADALECFIRKVGIADSEFTNSTGNGRVHLFVGGDPAPGGIGQGSASFSPELGSATFLPAATALWNQPSVMMTYDMMVLSCEGSQLDAVKRPLIPNIKAYADAGGRLITTHLHYYWLRNAAQPWPATAVFLDPQSSLPDPTPALVNTAFPQGAAMADWLVNVGASSTRGSLLLYGAQSTVASVNPPTQSWLSLANPASTEFMTFDTPVESAPGAHCGRVAHIDMHVKSTISTQNGKDTSDPTRPFPTGCAATIMNAQEQALEFLLFKVGDCVD